MPCACKNPPLNVPEGTEWGPVFWNLLHILAERSGNVGMVGIRPDEKRAWKNIITMLPKALPCDDCRKHFASYLAKHPFNIPDNYSQMNLYIKTWLYNVHEDVNLRLKKPSFKFEDLNQYKIINLRIILPTLEILMKRAIEGTAVGIIQWNGLHKNIVILKSMYF
jgi:hypothetical protein